MRQGTKRHTHRIHEADEKGTDVVPRKPDGPLRPVHRRLAATGRGKHVGQFSYYHRSAAALVPGILERIEDLRRQAHDRPFPFNVIKLDDHSRISFLRYDSFDAAFPVLLAALSCDLEKRTSRHATYQASRNPPILHRKELLLPTNDPRVRAGSRLTEWLERHGAFTQTATIGTREGWRRRLLEIGIGIPERPP